MSAQPTAVRRTVSFCQCIYDGTATVEGVTSRRVESVDEVKECLSRGEIPVLVDPDAAIRTRMPFDAVVDAILAKYNVNTRMDDTPIVLALGPELYRRAGLPRRGGDQARPLSGPPAAGGLRHPQHRRARRCGRLHHSAHHPGPAKERCVPIRVAHIGDTVAEGDIVARVDDEPVYAQMPGTVRGMLPDGLQVQQGMKSGDIDPRCEYNHCFTISDKARAIGGGVLEGLLYFRRRLLQAEHE